MDDKKRDSSSAGVGFALILLLVGPGLYKGWQALDGAGYLRHVVTAQVTAGPQWIVGETKDCTSIPVSSYAATVEHKYGDVFTELNCEDGPAHTVKIEFYGKQLQPGIKAAVWSCTRNSVSTFNDQAFTCKQTGVY